MIKFKYNFNALITITIIILASCVISGCTSRTPSISETKTQSSSTESPFADEFGCLPKDCSILPEGPGRKFCEEFQAGTYVWGDCSSYPSDACRKLCESRKASSSLETKFPGNESPFTDEFGCLPKDCSALPEGPGKQFCLDYQAGSYIWNYCVLYPSAECKKLCEKETASIFANMSEEQIIAYHNSIDKSYSVRGKLSQSVVKNGFDNAAPKTMYNLPYIKGGSISWLCSAVEKGEDYFLTNLTQEIRAMKNGIGVDYVEVRVEFTQDWRPETNGFVDNVFGFGEKACSNYVDPMDQILYVRTRLPAEQMRKVFSTIHNEGLKVILGFSTGPAPDAPSECYHICGTNVTEVLRKYKDLIMPYLQVAEEERVAMVEVGIEKHLDEDERMAEVNRMFSEEIIPAVRSEYSGYILYNENIQHLEAITFWSDVDYIGVDFYKGLTNKKDPTVSELETAIQDSFDKLVRPLQEKYNKPVVITETAYMSFDGENMPCNGDFRCQIGAFKWPEPPVDQQEQADEFMATFQFINKTPWMYGNVLYSPGYEITGWNVK